MDAVTTGEILAEGAPLKINWAEMPTYNTIMAVAAGAGLLLVVGLGRRLLTAGAPLKTEGWALAFGVLGTILTLSGLHMTLTWPLAAGGFPFDNVIFGEPSLAFGVLMLAAALFLWKRGRTLEEAPDRPAAVAALAGPVSVFVLGMGLAGIAFLLFGALNYFTHIGLIVNTM